MSSRPANDGTWKALVVPLDVVALCVGEIDQHDATKRFAGPTVDYSSQTKAGSSAYLGDNAGRGFDSAPGLSQLMKGVHLHWALPDALTHADTKDGKLDFPPCPDRWLVTRMVIDGSSPATRSWLVESDALSTTQQTSLPVTVPLTHTPLLGKDFAYLGRVTDAGATSEPPEARLADADMELTAVANGEAGFAAYYPSCASVFGFHDLLDDVVSRGGTRITYSVIGWYADETQDPVPAGCTPVDLETTLRWTFESGKESPSFSVYNGIVQGIEWDPERQYIHEQPVQKPLRVEAAIGDNAAEAFAAYFNRKSKEAAPLFEKLLVAFQLGQIDRLKNAQPNQIAKLEEAVHDAGFAGRDGGTIFTLATGEEGTDETALVDLPPPLADALNLLNVLEQKRHLCLLRSQWYRWQMFADWYRIFEIGEDTVDTASAVALERYRGWSDLEATNAGLASQVKNQRIEVEKHLPQGTSLKEVPAEPFVQPSDPTVLLVGEEIGFPERYGGDQRSHPSGNLVCRLEGDVLGSVSVAGKSIDATAFPVTAPAAARHPALVTSLLREACLLSAEVAAAVSGEALGTVRYALQLALAEEAQVVWSFAGRPPSRVGVKWWAPNLWLPLFASWSVDYLPLLDVDRHGDEATYPTNFLNARYRLDQDGGGSFVYEPDRTIARLEVDPSVGTFPKSYEGAGHLSATQALTLGDLLRDYLAGDSDDSLSTVANQLQSTGFLIAPLDGLIDLMTMRRHGIQLGMNVSSDSAYAEFTDALRSVVGTAPGTGPALNASYNPIRAGYMKLQLELVDAFGLKRKTQFDELACTTAMAARHAGELLPSVVHLKPRIAQPARLIFRWMAADSTEYDEANAHPAASPVCGWVVPNHLDGSLFLYNSQGTALGSLFLQRGHATAIGWQSAPGRDDMVGKDLSTALTHENAHLRDLATALSESSAETFTALWRTIDTVGATIEPGDLASNSGLAALVGRPLALVQACLRLELDGHPYLNLGWKYTAEDTDNGLTGVEFPVVVGNLARLEDGLIGFFKQEAPAGAYDFGRFYSHGADPESPGNVTRPRQETVCLTATPPVGAELDPDLSAFTQKLLMLVDPRARVHASTGILPTAGLDLPRDQTQASLKSLDFSFFTAPVLRGESSLMLPVPNETGYQLSWVEQVRTNGARAWRVTPEIDPPPRRGIWPYSPQSITEGWLRLNPVLLDFALVDAEGKPVVVGGTPNAVTLEITNKTARDITFRAGSLVEEGGRLDGSAFYLHLGDLVSQGDIPLIGLTAPGWIFEQFSHEPYGAYWGAAPKEKVTLEDGASLTVELTNLIPRATGTHGHVYFDYYGIDGVGDGVYIDVLAAEESLQRTQAG